MTAEPMTREEQVLWDYIEQESDELVLQMSKNVADDGFDRVDGPEIVTLKIMSAAVVKMLAIATEKTGRLDLATAYMEMVPMQIELIKVYSFKALERNKS